MSDDETPEGVKEFFSIEAVFQKDESPEGEFQATRLSQAKTSLYLDTPFFGWILGQLEIYPTNDSRISSYAADTRRIYFKPEYMEDKSPGRLKAMLMHLVTHLVMKHGTRMSSSDRNIWGMASDIVTNLIVEETKNTIFKPSRYQPDSSEWEVHAINDIPDHLQERNVESNYGILYNYADSLKGIEMIDDENYDPIDTVDPKNTFSSEIYEEVREYSGIENPCGFGLAMDLMGELMSDSMEKLEKERLSGIVRNAASQSKEFGQLPAEIREQVENLLNPKIPWYSLLEQFIQRVVISDWTWNPPNKRMIGLGYHFPSTTKEYLDVTVAVDTSGSISHEELSKFVSEAHAILASISSVRMTLIDCDAMVQQVLVIEEGQSVDGSPLPWEGRPFKGRGGTSFVPVFNWIEDNENQPDLLIYFTDGYGSFPYDEPGYPVVWVMTTDVEAPFGNVIRFDEE